jgi:cytochrome c biogenesis protein CcmG, thiol:disulfide interchange protein DsbE
VKKFAIPIAIFALLGVMLGYALVQMNAGEYSPRDIPSPLVGKPLPAFTLPSLADPTKTVTNEDLRGQPYLLNVWASWCVACRTEHGLLVAVARDHQVPIVGLNYKDPRDDALKWLQALGDPYRLSIADESGRYGIELGVYGVPETFVIDKDGVIRYKHIGPITAESWSQKLLPVLQRLSPNGGPAVAG